MGWEEMLQAVKKLKTKIVSRGVLEDEDSEFGPVLDIVVVLVANYD